VSCVIVRWIGGLMFYTKSGDPMLGRKGRRTFFDVSETLLV